MNAMPSTHHMARRELALALHEIGAVLTAASQHPLVVKRTDPQGKIQRGFRLKLHEKNPAAPLSPFFLNLRTQDNPKPGPLTEQHVEMAAKCMRDVLPQGLVFDAVAGVPRAGDPFAKALARLIGKPCIELEKYEHNGIRRVASLKGKIPASVRKVLLIDDLVTKADSKREAIEIFRDNSIEVTDAAVLADREQGGRNELDEWGCTLHSVFTITELFDLYVGAGKISTRLHTDVQKYLALAA